MTEQQFIQKIAIRLKEARKMKNLSKFQLAQSLNQSTDFIIKLESGEKRRISFYTIYKLCEVLDLDLEYFID